MLKLLIIQLVNSEQISCSELLRVYGLFRSSASKRQDKFGARAIDALNFVAPSLKCCLVCLFCNSVTFMQQYILCNSVTFMQQCAGVLNVVKINSG